MDEDDIVSELPDSWDYVDTNIVYSNPLPSNSAPPEIIYADETSCIGEKDVFLYNREPENSGVIGYLEVKSSNSYWSMLRAEDQLQRAQEHWNRLGYDFVGGFIGDGTIKPWTGEKVDLDRIKIDNFNPDTAPKSGSDPKDVKPEREGTLASKLEGLGWDEAFEDVIYGKSLETDMAIKNEGLIQSDEHNGHFGKMDAVGIRDNGKGMIIAHFEKRRNSLDKSGERLDRSFEFWKDRGYHFQGAVFDDGEIIRRDPENQEWVDSSPS